MANKGLYKYANNPVISNSFGTDDICYINIEKENNNLFIDIPILDDNEGVNNKIGPISLIYTRSEEGHNEEFGKGIRMNYYKRITYISRNSNNLINYITVENPDFTTNTYYLNDKYISSENNTFLNFEVDYDEDNNYYNYSSMKLYDKEGNYFYFNTIDFNSLPTKFVKANGDEINMLNNNGNQVLRFGFYEILFEINLSGFVSCVKFLFSNLLITKVDLLYENNYLKRIQKYLITRNKNNIEKQS